MAIDITKVAELLLRVGRRDDLGPPPGQEEQDGCRWVPNADCERQLLADMQSEFWGRPCVDRSDEEFEPPPGVLTRSNIERYLRARGVRVASVEITQHGEVLLGKPIEFAQPVGVYSVKLEPRKL